MKVLYGHRCLFGNLTLNCQFSRSHKNAEHNFPVRVAEAGSFAVTERYVWVNASGRDIDHDHACQRFAEEVTRFGE